MSAFTTKDIRMETCVVPFAFRNVRVGIEQILTADLFRYVFAPLRFDLYYLCTMPHRFLAAS
jgi:hypothetical protein